MGSPAPGVESPAPSEDDVTLPPPIPDPLKPTEDPGPELEPA